MRKNIRLFSLLLAVQLLVPTVQSQAEVLCRNKKSGQVAARQRCTKKERGLATLAVSTSENSATAGASTLLSIAQADSGALASGADLNTGLDISLSRLGAVAGTVNTTGLNLEVVGDTGGDSTNIGLSVTTTGADANYCAIFQGGNVGIGVSDPDEQLELTGRIHLGQSTAPAVGTDKLYNVGGTLYWNGQEVDLGPDATPSPSGGTITGVTAGTGLSGGGTSGAVTLSVDTGTSASKIVQLNASAELPAVSGANLTALSATNISAGTLSDSRLSANVSLLGSSIALSSEVSGTLPVASGGTGAVSLSDLIALGTHTSGNYVTSVSTSGGISGGASASEGAALALSVDTAFSPTWSGTHSFSSNANFGTSAASTEAMHLNGRLHIEPNSAPGTTTDRLYNVGGALFFNGQNLTTGALGGDITGITAGTGLTGGGATGDLTLNVDVGIVANKIVQLDGSARLPAVSAANLTELDANDLSSGTVPDARLSSAVSLLGTSIALTSEVSGTLPVGNGGTGATSLADLITLGTHTSGNYVAAVAAGTGITLGTTGAEGGTATLSLNQALAPTWTASHTFSGVTTDITTATNENLVLAPNGTGKLGVGTTSPSAMIDTVYTSTNSTAGTEGGLEVNMTDTGTVSSGTDTTYGIEVNLSRSGATAGSINSTGLDVQVTGTTGATSTATGINVSVGGADVNYAALFDGGNVGVGTSSPTAKLDVRASSTDTTAGSEVGANVTLTDTGAVAAGTDSTSGLVVAVSRTGATAGTFNSKGLDVSVTGSAAGTSTAVGLAVAVSGADSNVAATFSGGSVGVGDTTQVLSDNVPSGSVVVGNGSVCVDDGTSTCDDVARSTGRAYATAFVTMPPDLAEDFPVETNDPVEAAEIVAIDTHEGDKCIELGQRLNGERECLRSERALLPFVTRAQSGVTAAKRVLGVISTLPGITLGGFAQHELVLYRKVPVALAGRVPLKVSLENGPIELGDRLTLSSAPGVGMRADEGQMAVGIALEPLAAEAGPGTHMVLVLVK